MTSLLAPDAPLKKGENRECLIRWVTEQDQENPQASAPQTQAAALSKQENFQF